MELFVRGKGVHILKEEKEVQPVFSETKSFFKALHDYNDRAGTALRTEASRGAAFGI